ncbi:MAG: TetR/AcrR family transcriptional regulator [Pseudomonadales bacterium]|nr:TetR/AcrR family transcriptional regulator [Pseudomonadales bacterium]
MEKNNWKAKAGTPDYLEAKQKIVDVAIELIAEKSVSKLRFEELAKRVGCVRTTIYRYFDSKEELLTEVMTALMYQMAVDVALYTVDNKQAPSKDTFTEGIFHTITRLRTDSRYRVVMDSDNIDFFAQLAVDRMPEKIAPILSSFINDDQATDMQLNNGLTIEEACAWLAIQIISYAQFGLLGKTEEEQKAFVNKMIVSVMITES